MSVSAQYPNMIGFPVGLMVTVFLLNNVPKKMIGKIVIFFYEKGENFVKGFALVFRPLCMANNRGMKVNL